MAFQQGLSGLNSASKALEVIGNNVANTSTVGFKESNAQFADIYASALNGTNASLQVGIGATVSAVSQLFSQGNITSTSNSLDVAINGAGFYRVSDNGSIAYTRDGQFDVDKSGYIVTSQGYRLTGYLADANGVIQPAAPTDIKINTSDLPPEITSNAAIGLNLDSRVDAPTAAFDETDANTYNSSTSFSAYDSLGNAHVLTLYFRKVSGGQWDVYQQLDGGTTSMVNTSPTLTFNTDGTLASGASQTLSLTIPASYGATSPQALTLDFTGSTQFGSDFGVNSKDVDGYASGRLSGISIGTDGIVLGRYSNGESQNLGQVVLANFASPNGLTSLGNNLWAESSMSGQPLVGTPGSGSLGSLQSGAVEDSNVDLTSELVDMITQQRAYQANAQSIRTEDQIMQTLINLR